MGRPLILLAHIQAAQDQSKLHRNRTWIGSQHCFLLPTFQPTTHPPQSKTPPLHPALASLTSVSYCVPGPIAAWGDWYKSLQLAFPWKSGVIVLYGTFVTHLDKSLVLIQGVVKITPTWTCSKWSYRVVERGGAERTVLGHLRPLICLQLMQLVFFWLCFAKQRLF